MVTPKKSLGQHWLHDTHILHRIVETAELDPGQVVLEIGPGLGTLTGTLLSAGADVIAVEYDQDLFRNLEKRNNNHLAVINQDILSFDLTSLAKDYKVVANIPYYLTSNLIRVLSESENPPISATLLVQKEVAERLCAGPGAMSILAVTAQMYFSCTLHDVVPAKLFTPPPKVDSQIVHLIRREVPLFEQRPEREVFRIVKAGFANKRKTLINSLSGSLQMGKSEVAEWLDRSGISTNARPQELSLSDWLRLYDKK